MAISHRLTLLSLGLLISLQAGGADSAWIDDRLKKPSVIEPSALDQMTAFIIGQILPLAVPGNAADWTEEAESLRERVLEEVVFKGVPEYWREGNHQVVWGEIIETG